MLPGSPSVGVLGISSWKESQGQTQNALTGLLISSGLETASEPPGGAGQCCRGYGCLGFLTQTDATVTCFCIRLDPWMDGWIEQHNQFSRGVFIPT